MIAARSYMAQTASWTRTRPRSAAHALKLEAYSAGSTRRDERAALASAQACRRAIESAFAESKQWLTFCPMLTPAQIRAARAMLDWTQRELAERAGISKTGLNNIERGSADPKASTLTAIWRAIEDAGVEFTNGDEPGVKLKATQTKKGK
jgi:DNA-binding XRE family transcriptional regulator